MATNVPALSFTASGISLPAESDILAGVQADLNDAFGGNLNPSLETPQGQIATSQTAIIAEKNSQIAYVANQIDPAYSSGRWQDAIGRIYWMTRSPGTSTAVAAKCMGAEGVVIPLGSITKDSGGNTYYSTEAGTIGADGIAYIPFECSVVGPIPCPTGNLSVIYKSISGWDSITNLADGVLGRDVESRADFEYRRKSSVAANAAGFAESIRGAVFTVAGVNDVYIYDNDTSAPVVIGETDRTIPDHSIFVAVYGGRYQDIAQKIYEKKPPGCGTSGDNSVTVYDENYDYPQPSYTIKYQTASSIPIKFSIELAYHPLLPSNIIAQVKSSVVDTFNGITSGTRARIGSKINAGQYYGGISTISQYVDITSLLLGVISATETTITIGIDQFPTISESNITVTVV